MARKCKVSGEWRDVSRRYCKVNGAWRAVRERYAKIAGVWKLVQRFFAVGGISQGISYLTGQYSAGVMSDGNLGATISGYTSSYYNPVSVGIRLYDLPENASVSFLLDLEIDGTDLTLIVVNSGGGQAGSWTSSTTNHTVSFSYWTGGTMDLVLTLRATSQRTGSFSIRNIYINGVKQ